VSDGSRWTFELKHDGYRFIGRREAIAFGSSRSTPRTGPKRCQVQKGTEIVEKDKPLATPVPN